MFNKISFLHFSIDDVIDAFRLVHDSLPESIFNVPFFKKLYQWHNKYWLSFDLYVFEEKDGFKLSELQDRYWDELKKNSWWLRIGWHQIRPGKIESEINQQIESAKRVHELVKSKCLERGWSRTIRLHYFWGEAKLIRFLYDDLGVNCFLTADCADRQSYDLDMKICAQIYGGDSFFRNDFGVLYKTTDLRLDEVGSEFSVKDAISILEKRMNFQTNVRTMELFCHECRLVEKSVEIEKLLELYMNINKNVYINTLCANEEKTFFITTHFNKLFEYKNSNSIVDVADMALETHITQFSSIFSSENKIWMVPWTEKAIFVYDTCLHVVNTYNLPYQNSYTTGQYGHRKAIKYGRYIWMLPIREKALVRINIDNPSIKLFYQFPQGVIFDEDGRMPFKCMDLYNGKLYLFADGCSHNIIADAETGEMEIWNDDFKGVFGAIMDENTAVISPTYEEDPVSFYDIKNRTFTDAKLPSNVWNGSKIYAFWYMHRIDDYMYILPHEANGIVRIDCKSKAIRIIELPEYNYKTLRNNTGFSGYDLIKVGEEVWASAYSGNNILRIDTNGQVIGILDMKIPLKNLTPKKLLFSNFFYESQMYSLDFFITGLNASNYEEKDFVIEE